MSKSVRILALLICTAMIAAPVIRASDAPPLSEADIMLIARFVQAEAGDAPLICRVGVAAVIINRIASSHFPDTAAAVIFESGEFASASCGMLTCDTDVPENVIDEVRRAAAGLDPTDGSLYFCGEASNRRGIIPTLTAGGMIFGRECASK